ncbi:hypothetical protein VKT23_016426 [Stygiomarasmius scandens]|uniref:Heterokaryon incompatibility domain-containing protein n=1 Tax=Marasmiellus scandens TaxID=2682957 RepID=A0ABR1IV46_9AGAR
MPSVEQFRRLWDRVFESSSQTQHLITSSNACPQRLIDVCTLKLVEFHERADVPPYAILSHRWIFGQEVTLQEFSEVRNAKTSKSGYHKIRAACRQAFKDGFRYIWVDTCCIDKGNHDDVARNIRFMYSYYEKSEVCYAHLADVNVHPGGLQSEWEWDFQRSEWFERGWTLQELLAPRKVIFFDKHWTRLGTNHDLQDTISWITTIPPEILSGQQSLLDIDPLERMAWAVGRETTKPQDQAYCLLGLLGVSMDPDYDEDVRVSFERLKKAFLNVHPEHKDALSSVEDFYSFLNDRYQMARRDAIFGGRTDPRLLSSATISHDTLATIQTEDGA